jgi:hypothetical protein
LLVAFVVGVGIPMALWNKAQHLHDNEGKRLKGWGMAFLALLALGGTGYMCYYIELFVWNPIKAQVLAIDHESFR